MYRTPEAAAKTMRENPPSWCKIVQFNSDTNSSFVNVTCNTPEDLLAFASKHQ